MWWPSMDILMTVIIHRLHAIHKALLFFFFCWMHRCCAQTPWLMDELAIYCFHCLLGNTSKWLRAPSSGSGRGRRPVEKGLSSYSAVNNNTVGVVYNSITTTRRRRKRQRPTVTGDISAESHSQYLASLPPHTYCYLWLRFPFVHSKYCLCSLLIITASTSR